MELHLIERGENVVGELYFRNYGSAGGGYPDAGKALLTQGCGEQRGDESGTGTPQN
jgi:hypothetical protein